jgi:hypothetical protein
VARRPPILGQSRRSREAGGKSEGQRSDAHFPAPASKRG